MTETGEPTLKDCMFIARSSIGTVPCEPCVCDTNGSGDVRITDALRCLWFVVGAEVTLDCPPCAGSTTTTLSACASCSDVLAGVAEEGELCDASQLLYDAMRNCPCDACAEECGAVCRTISPASGDLATRTAAPCWGCLVEQCRQSLADCLED